MPRFDGTGPMGAGPMSGWGRGYCDSGNRGYGPAPALGPAYSGPGYGPAFGRGLGPGQGFRRGFGPGPGRGRGYGPGFGRSRSYGGACGRQGPTRGW